MPRLFMSAFTFGGSAWTDQGPVEGPLQSGRSLDRRVVALGFRGCEVRFQAQRHLRRKDSRPGGSSAQLAIDKTARAAATVGEESPVTG